MGKKKPVPYAQQFREWLHEQDPRPKHVMIRRGVLDAIYNHYLTTCIGNLESPQSRWGTALVPWQVPWHIDGVRVWPVEAHIPMPHMFVAVPECLEETLEFQGNVDRAAQWLGVAVKEAYRLLGKAGD